VGMFAHSSSLYFYKSKKNLKCCNGKANKLQMKVLWKWTSYSFQCTKKKGRHRKFIEEVLTWTMKPPHCLTRKCQKLNQLLSTWTLASEPAPDDSHQTNESIMTINIPKQFGILILVAKSLMFILHVKSD
jgi:hypothetical protein